MSPPSIVSPIEGKIYGVEIFLRVKSSCPNANALRTHIVDLGWGNMHVYHFFVSGPAYKWKPKN